MTAPRPTAVEVLEVRSVTGHGNLRAFAKVKLGCIVIHGCRVIQQPGQRPWVALPQTPAREKKADGFGSGWYAVLEITNRSVLDQLRDAVLEAWEAHCAAAAPGRRDLPTRGGRQSHEPLEERADAWSKRQRDERGPDEVPF